MRQPRILVIDDSATVLQVVEAALSADYVVETAIDGADGLAKARRSLPDLIVTDSIMPGLDGLALLRTLKDDPATCNIPGIVLTSDDLPARPVRFGDPQPVAVVLKSMDMAPLLSAIKLALSDRIHL
jgi:CheY-like chemotaxis protein